jgi:hypothetical protein
MCGLESGGAAAGVNVKAGLPQQLLREGASIAGLHLGRTGRQPATSGRLAHASIVSPFVGRAAGGWWGHDTGWVGW